MLQPPSQPSSSHPIDRDLYCLICGYNLRGLKGDPVRCPECGAVNSPGGAYVPTRFISQQVRRMERDIEQMLFALLGGLVFQALFWLWVWAEGGLLVAPGFVCVGIPAFGGLALWGAGCARARAYCGGRAGWARALLQHHVWSLLQVLLVIAAAAVCICPALFVSWKTQVWFAIPVAIACVVGASVVWVFVHRRLHKRAWAALLSLSEDVLTDRAREAMRNRMAQKRRGLLR